MKEFITDTILDAENICNLSRESKILEKGIELKHKMVVYGRRNSGKTSLVQSVTIASFQKQHKRSFVLDCDLMEVRSLSSIDERISKAFSKAFSLAFPAKTFLKAVKEYLQGMSFQIKVDSLTGEPALAFESSGAKGTLTQTFEVIRKKIAPTTPTLIVLDEFQDIAGIDEAQGLLRAEFQIMKNIPIILLGSKQHILTELFAKAKAPFADFGIDIEFSDIPYDEYTRYLTERLGSNLLEPETSRFLQDLMQRNPEAINIVGKFIVENYTHQKINNEFIAYCIDKILMARRARFDFFLTLLTETQMSVVKALAKVGKVQEPTGKMFLKEVSLSHGTVLKIFRDLMDNGILERVNQQYRIQNPLFKFYLDRYC